MVARLLFVWLVIQLVIAAVAYGGDTVPMPADGKDPLVGYVRRDTVQRGILLYREVYDLNGRKIAIEESSDAPERTKEKAKASEAKKTRPQTGGETVSGSLLLSPAPSPVQTFLYWGGHWYQSDGTQWRYHSTPVTARSVPQAHPTMPVMYAQPVPVVSSSWPVGFQMGSMFIGAEIVEQVGVTNGCPPGG